MQNKINKRNKTKQVTNKCTQKLITKQNGEQNKLKQIKTSTKNNKINTKITIPVGVNHHHTSHIFPMT